MKKLIVLLMLVFGTFAAFAQTAPTPDKFGVSYSVGSAMLRPNNPQFTNSIGLSYKFAPNYPNTFFDTAYASFGYTHDAATSYHVGLQRTMKTDRDRLGLLGVVEGGFHRLAGSGVVRPSGAVGLGLTFDFAGNPYPAWMDKLSLSCVPTLNKVERSPMFWSLTFSVSRSFSLHK